MIAKNGKMNHAFDEIDLFQFHYQNHIVIITKLIQWIDKKEAFC